MLIARTLAIGVKLSESNDLRIIPVPRSKNYDRVKISWTSLEQLKIRNFKSSWNHYLYRTKQGGGVVINETKRESFENCKFLTITRTRYEWYWWNENDMKNTKNQIRGWLINLKRCLEFIISRIESVLNRATIIHKRPPRRRYPCKDFHKLRVNFHDESSVPIQVVGYNSFASIQLKLAKCQNVEELMNLHGPNQI